MSTNQETPNAAPANEKVISKMSIKTLGCNPRVASAKPENDTTPVQLAVVFGTAMDTKSGEDAKGAVWNALIGDFAGINLQTGQADFGQTFKSGKLFLPGGIHELIEAAVIGDGQGDPRSVEFALEILAVRASNPIGYSYQAIPRIRPVQEDSLSRIRAAIAQQLPLPAAPLALPAPAAPAAPASEPTAPVPAPAPVVQMPAATTPPAVEVIPPAKPAPAPAATGRRRR